MESCRFVPFVVWFLVKEELIQVKNRVYAVSYLFMGIMDVKAEYISSNLILSSEHVVLQSISTKVYCVFLIND